MISIIVFCFTVSAQTTNNDCQKIIIKAPNYVYTETKFEVHASYEKVDSADTTLFNWTIINRDEVTKVKETNHFEITSKDIEYGKTGKIIVLAESLNKKCNDIAIVRIPFFRHVGSPVVFHQYGEIRWENEKPILDYVASEINLKKDSELLIFVSYDNKLQNKGVKTYLSKILKHLTFRGLRKDQVSFLTKYSKSKETKFQLFPKELNASDVYSDYLIIKGEDLEKLAKMFK